MTLINHFMQHLQPDIYRQCRLNSRHEILLHMVNFFFHLINHVTFLTSLELLAKCDVFTDTCKKRVTLKVLL